MPFLATTSFLVLGLGPINGGAKFTGPEGERLGQLVVTPEVVATKINNMEENKSLGVDGISPKILKQLSNKSVHHLHTCLTCDCSWELYL